MSPPFALRPSAITFSAAAVSDMSFDLQAAPIESANTMDIRDSVWDFICPVYRSLHADVYRAAIGGMRAAHGRAVSSCAASWNSVASSPNGAVNCTPIGRPAAFQNSGTLIAGTPV
jgi:hypothetical protein